MNNDFSAFFDANRQLWNQRTIAHKNSSFYGLEDFKKGATVLNAIELNEVGDVAGKKMLHLQCHFGMDSLDWARRGALVTGVDISDTAIAEARLLNDELGLSARFICCNVYDLEQHLDEPFDIVFTSYGVIGWLPDLDRWAKLVARYLAPGGVFYMAEFHPVVWMFDDEFTHIKYSYANLEMIVTESSGTYADREADIKSREYSWNHSISEVLNALIGAGLKIEFFNEYLHSPYPCFSNCVQGDGGHWYIRGLEKKIPMLYSVKATK